MRRLSERWLVVALIFVTATYAIAEDITLTTYYPSPRGVYQDVRVNNAMRIGSLNAPAANRRLQLDRSGDNTEISLNDNLFLDGQGGTGRITNNAYINNGAWALADGAARGATIELRDTGVIDLYGTVTPGALDWRQMMGIDAPNNTVSFPSGTVSVAGDLSVGAGLTLGTVRRTAWPVLNFGNFMGGDDFNSNPGTNPAGGTAVSQVEWVKCSYRNGGGFGTGIWTANSSGPAGYACYWRLYNDGCGGAGQPACPNRTALMAVCPQNWKLLSGGTMSYHGTVNDIRPDGVVASYPNSWDGYNLIPAGGGSGSWGSVIVGSQEGWVEISNNSPGFDANIFWASCGH